jgi:protein O-mannosyl-transferase
MKWLINRALAVWPSFLICLSIIAAYVPTFSGDFILDDKPLVKDNPYIMDFHSLPSYLSQEDGIVRDESGENHSGYYRPIINLSYTIDYKIWGMAPFGFRMTNLFLHLATCLLLYKTIGLGIGKGAGSLWAVLLFGLHPVNTEAISWITSRNNILVAFFCLTSFYFYIKREQGSGRWCSFVALLSFAAALFCKEFAVMLLPILFLYDRLLSGKKRPITKELCGYVPFIGIIIFYLALREMATDSLITPGDVGHIWKGIFFAPFLIMYNLRIILLPYGLHNFIIHYPEKYFGPEAVLGFVGIALIGWLLWRCRDKKHLLFSFFSFLVALFPVLHIIPTASVSLISMRWLYFPMIFLCLGVSLWFNKIFKSNKRISVSILLGLALLYTGTYTYILNENLWKTENDFFEEEVLLFGNDFYAKDLARTYHLRGDYKTAYHYYQRAIKGNAGTANMYVNLGALFIDINRPEIALHYLDMAESLRPVKRVLARLYNNKGAAYFKIRNYSNSGKFLLMAVKIAPDEPKFLINLGNAYSAMGNHTQAISVFKRCLHLDTDHVLLNRNLCLNYFAMGDYFSAVKFLEKMPYDIRKRDPEVKKMLERALRKSNKLGQTG